ncbi:MAG: hypothetical protein ABFD83_05505 [Armatimonadota bacterium]
MRRTLFIVPILLATATVFAFAEGKTAVDPNMLTQKQTIQPVRDPRLDQKITYKAKLRPITDIADDLTNETGITFYAGHNLSDWRVREDCTTVMAADIPLSTLMDSIAHTLHFKWVRGGKSPNWTYRLIEDPAAIAGVNKRVAELKEIDAKKRKAAWDKFMSIPSMSEQELAKLKEDDPKHYLLLKAGVLSPLIDFLKQTPSVAEAWLAGDELKLSSSWLSTGSRNALANSMLAYLKLHSQILVDDGESKDRENSRLDKLNQEGAPIKVDLYKSNTPSDIPWLNIAVGDDYVYLPLHILDSESSRLREKAFLQAYENRCTFWDIYDQVIDQIVAAREKEALNSPKVCIDSYTQEPIIEHSDDPAIDVPLKEKVASKTITGMVAALADNSGFAIVTDNFRGKTNLAFDKDSKLRSALETISMKSYYYNWNRNDNVIELWDVHWYDIREGRIANALRERLRKKFQDTGTLDIDDLAEVASLNDEQIRRSITNDDILRFAVDTMWKQREYLKIYASFAAAQRSMLFSDAGLAYGSLNPGQQQSIAKLMMGISSPLLVNLDIASSGARITCTKQTNGKRFIYTFKACTNFGDIPGEYHLRTPVYVDPKHRDEKKP